MVNKDKFQRMPTCLSVYVYPLQKDLLQSIRKKKQASPAVLKKQAASACRKNKRHPQYLRNRQHRHAAKDPGEIQKTKSGKSRGGPKKHEIPRRRN